MGPRIERFELSTHDRGVLHSFRELSPSPGLVNGPTSVRGSAPEILVVHTEAPAGKTLAAFDTSRVRLVGIAPAAELTLAVGRRRYLHSGPPIGLEEIPGPMRGALLGALVFEDEARDLEAAAKLIHAGEVQISPCHDAGAVGAMAGIITPTMPVIVVESGTGRLAFSPINEGLGKALRFGSNDAETLDRLRWLRDSFAPLADRAIRGAGEIDLTELQAEGLRRGDECHNRNAASTAALVVRLAPQFIRSARKSDDPARAIEQASSNPHFFLPFSMASAKVIADSGHGVAGSPIVTAMAGNGRRLGIRVSGLGGRWFFAPAPVGTPKLFPGFSIHDAQPTMGDSFITETVGLGAFALSASPAICSFVGGDPARAHESVAEMRRICAGTSSRFLLPFERFRGTPVGIDVRKVAETGVAPLTNNGLAHREPGRGQVGAGLTRLPSDPFVEASRVLHMQRGQTSEPLR